MVEGQAAYKMRKTDNLKFVIAILLSIIFIEGCQNPNDASFKNNKESFREKPIQFTKHAQCLMDCKHLSESEIEKLISNGKLNSKESFPEDKPCPTYAVEGLTTDRKSVV